MIVPDVNLLIYAYDETSSKHDVARRWWEDTLSGAELVGIAWVVVLAFVRLTTHPTLSENPMTIEQARAAVDSWFAQSHVRLLDARSTSLALFFELLASAGTGGNLSTDALIAALAQEHGGIVHSNDVDFNRFPDLRWRNPLEPR